MANLTVSNNLVVGLEYTLRLDDGEVIDSSDNNVPLEYLHGHGQLIPGLERELHGMSVGDEKTVTVAPEEGYGEYDEDAFEAVPLSAFPDDVDLSPGLELHMRDSATGHIIQAFVAEVNDDAVILDLNHPLAGEALTFDVKIASLRKATQEELEHGHVHGEGGHHH